MSLDEGEGSLMCSGGAAANVQGFQFEPLIDRNQRLEEEFECSSSDSNSESEPGRELGQGDYFPTNTINQWCKCGNCQPMPTAKECRCCHSYSIIRELMEGYTCVTEHPGFAPNCLERWVLLADRHEFEERDGPIGDEVPPNDVLRFLAYKRFVYLVWHKLGKGNRRVLPACVVLAIRRKYPDPTGRYTGYKEAI